MSVKFIERSLFREAADHFDVWNGCFDVMRTNDTTSLHFRLHCAEHVESSVDCPRNGKYNECSFKRKSLLAHDIWDLDFFPDTNSQVASMVQTSNNPQSNLQRSQPSDSSLLSLSAFFPSFPLLGAPHYYLSRAPLPCLCLSLSLSFRMWIWIFLFFILIFNFRSRKKLQWRCKNLRWRSRQ